MKKAWITFLCLLLLTGCAPSQEPAQIAATTLPVYEFTCRLCQGTPLGVTRLVTEEVSCLHNYSLNVRQVKAAEAAQTIVLSGGGLEEFMEELLLGADTIDASLGIAFICHEEESEHHSQEDHLHEAHHHETDPHFWLSPACAQIMAQNICEGLSQRYPEHTQVFERNLEALKQDLQALQRYGEQQLGALSCRELVTFHDGFSYLAQSFDLTILEAVEEESGSEASAKKLIELVQLLRQHHIPAVFTEESGAVSAAGILARETGCGSYALDMAMAGDSYFEAVYHNIDTIREALK